MAYLLDANVFMQAKNLHYGMDFCPAFWDWLIASNAAQGGADRGRSCPPGRSFTMD
jgi:hypothetical protein